MRRQAIANYIAVGLVIVALVVGAVGYYALTTYSVRTETATTTQIIPSTETVLGTETILSATTLYATSTEISTTTYTLVSSYTVTFGGPTLGIEEESCAHTAGAKLFGLPAAGAAANSCLLAITNTGSAIADITGCSIYGTTQTLVGAPVAVPAGTTFAAPVVAECDSASALTPGAAVSGSLVTSEVPLAFSAIAAA
jgi:hypothetical protein